MASNDGNGCTNLSDFNNIADFSGVYIFKLDRMLTSRLALLIKPNINIFLRNIRNMFNQWRAPRSLEKGDKHWLVGFAYYLAGV